uniref:Uncharacterized protein n=1 Tax=Anguilla anguilla TaxID=7936 RepID=A0A0E9SVM3_ANGAN
MFLRSRPHAFQISCGPNSVISEMLLISPETIGLHSAPQTTSIVNTLNIKKHVWRTYCTNPLGSICQVITLTVVILKFAMEN